MKKLLKTFLVLAFLFVAFNTPANSAGDRPLESSSDSLISATTTITKVVDVNDGWLNTGIHVLSGWRVTFVADPGGRWILNDSPPCDAKGYNTKCGSGCMVVGAHHGSLVAKIGPVQLEVGMQGQMDIGDGQGGVIFIGCNKGPGNFGRNGQVAVTMTIERIP